MANTTQIKIRKKGVFLGSEGNQKRIADPIRVTAFATSNQNTAGEQAFVVIRFLDRRGKWKEEIILSSMLTGSALSFVTFMSGRGYLWPANRKWRAKIIDALSVARPDKNLWVTDLPGWHGKVFVLPGESYGPKGSCRERLQLNHNPVVGLGEFRHLSTLENWKKHVAKECVHSSRARLALAAVFAAPNLRPLNMDSFGYNFYAESSGGKTLLLRWALSAAGLNSAKGPASWSGSPAAFEQRALGHRDCVMPLDDLSHLQGDPTEVAKIVTFRLAGNKPKAKAGQYVVAHNLVEADWRVIPLSTSEHPLWQPNRGPRRGRIRGEQVRMIDIPACCSDMDDVFDGARSHKGVGKTVEERVRFVERQESLTLKYQGVAFCEYLTKLTTDPLVTATLRKYMQQFREATPLPYQVPWLARIRRDFEITYASAALAIDYGILPWGRKSTLTAIKRCMRDAMTRLLANLEPTSTNDAAPADEALLTKFRSLIDAAVFVSIDPRKRRKKSFVARLERADGIKRRNRSAKLEPLLLSKTFAKWFPEVSQRKRLARLLLARRAFKSGRRKDTSTRQVFIAELGGKISCYAMSRKWLRSD